MQQLKARHVIWYTYLVNLNAGSLSNGCTVVVVGPGARTISSGAVEVCSMHLHNYLGHNPLFEKGFLLLVLQLVLTTYNHNATV